MLLPMKWTTEAETAIKRVPFFVRKKVRARVIGEIPFDRNIHDALMLGKTVLEHGKGPAVEIIKQVWTELRKTMEE